MNNDPGREGFTWALVHQEGKMMSFHDCKDTCGMANLDRFISKLGIFLQKEN